MEARPRTLEERWILARIEVVRGQLERALGEFDFSEAMSLLYHLVFDDFCDWYAEAVKQRLYDGDGDAQATALAALERLLELLHPAMPHVTEEIWSNLPGRESRLIVAPWPEAGPADDADALERIQEAAVTFRAQRRARPARGPERKKRIFDLVVRPERQRANGNVEAERDRLRAEIARAEGKLANESFVAKAPPDVVQAERDKLERYRREPRCPRQLTGSRRSRPGPRSSGSTGCEASSPTSATRSCPSRRSTSSARTASRRPPG